MLEMEGRPVEGGASIEEEGVNCLVELGVVSRGCGEGGGVNDGGEGAEELHFESGAFLFNFPPQCSVNE